MNFVGAQANYSWTFCWKSRSSNGMATYYAKDSTTSEWSTNRSPQKHMLQYNPGGMVDYQEVLGWGKGWVKIAFSVPSTRTRMRGWYTRPHLEVIANYVYTKMYVRNHFTIALDIIINISENKLAPLNSPQIIALFFDFETLTPSFTRLCNGEGKRVGPA